MYNFVRNYIIIFREISTSQKLPCPHAVWSLALDDNLDKPSGCMLLMFDVPNGDSAVLVVHHCAAGSLKRNTWRQTVYVAYNVKVYYLVVVITGHVQ